MKRQCLNYSHRHKPAEQQPKFLLKGFTAEHWRDGYESRRL